MQNTYSVFTALNVENSSFKKTITLKAPSFHQAAINALRFFGWNSAGPLTLTNSEKFLRAYQSQTMQISVLQKA